MYIYVPGHMVDYIGFILGIYTDNIAACAHELHVIDTCGLYVAF